MTSNLSSPCSAAPSPAGGVANLAVGIVTYHPGEPLLHRLQLTVDAGFPVYVFDNSPDEPAVRDFCRRNAGCIYLTAGKNLGLGIAITMVCAQAFHEGMGTLLFFDQDSVFDASTLAFALRLLKEQPALARTHAVVTLRASHATVSSGEPGAPEITEVPLTINSGSLYFLASAKAIGWHDQTYFVDGVDYEYCLRAHRHGLRVAECVGAPGFDHQAEQGDLLMSLPGWVRRGRKYSPRRIRDSATANMRLATSALLAGQWQYFIRFGRILLGYLTLQVLARALGKTPPATDDNASSAK